MVTEAEAPPADTHSLDAYRRRLRRGQPWRWRGQVLQVVGQTIESAGPNSSVGECCEIVDCHGRPHLAEVIGFRGSTVLSMPVNSPEGIRYGDAVEALGMTPEIEVGPALMGRVLDGLGEPIDGGRRPAASGAGADPNVSRNGNSRPRCTPDGRTRAKSGNLWRIGRGQEHPDRHDDP